MMSIIGDIKYRWIVVGLLHLLCGRTSISITMSTSVVASAIEITLNYYQEEQRMKTRKR